MKIKSAALFVFLAACTSVTLPEARDATNATNTPEERAGEDAPMRMGNNIPVKNASGSTISVVSVTNGGVELPMHGVSDPDGSTFLDVQTEDSAVPSGIRGLVPLAQRRDADTTLADTDGDAAPLQVGPEGWLKVEDMSGGGGGGGTSMVDDAAFTPGTTDVTPMAAEFDDAAPDSVDEGDGGAVRMSGNRNLYTTLRDAAGNERGANVTASNQLQVADSTVVAELQTTTLVDDAAFMPATSEVTPMGATFDDSATDSVNEGDIGAPRMSANRVLYGTIRDAAGNERGANVNASNELLTANSVLTAAGNVDDAAFGVATDTVLSLGALFDDVSPDTVNEGDAMALRGSARRELYTQIRDAAGNERGVNVDASNQMLVVDSGLLTALQDVTKVDDAAFTPGSSKVLMIGAEIDDTATDTANEGDAVALRATPDRKLLVANSSTYTAFWSGVDTSASSNSSEYDATQCAELWVEVLWSAAAVTATGSIEVYGGVVTPSDPGQTDTIMILGADADADRSLINSDNCSITASPADQIDYSVATGQMPEHCIFRIPHPAPYLTFRHVAGTGGSAGDLYLYTQCRHF